MSTDEREAFLADLHVGVIAVERPDGPPLAVPVWYRFLDGVVEVTTEEASVKARLLRTAGRASLSVQREEYPYAYVTVEGPVTFGEATQEQRIAIAARYLGAEAGAGYVASTQDGEGGGDDVAITLTPERWLTVDYSKL